MLSAYEQIDRIRSYIKSHNINATAAGKAAGYTNRSWLNDLSKRRSPISDEELERIASALGTTPAYLMGETDQKEKIPAMQESEIMKLYNAAPPEWQQAALDLLRRATKQKEIES